MIISFGVYEYDAVIIAHGSQSHNKLKGDFEVDRWYYETDRRRWAMVFDLNLRQIISKTPCHPEGAYFATEGSLAPGVDILCFAQDDIFETSSNYFLKRFQIKANRKNNVAVNTMAEPETTLK